MQAPGRILLLVTGIIYIVMGVYAVIFGLFTEFIGQVIGGWGHMADVQGVETEMDALVFYLVLGGIYSFIIGIMGVAHRNNLDKGATLMVLGIIRIIMDLGSLVIFDLTSYLTVTSALLYIIPICYIAGGYKNKQGALEAIRQMKYNISKERENGGSAHPTNSIPLARNMGSTWFYNKCSEENMLTAPMCKGRGSYK